MKFAPTLLLATAIGVSAHPSGHAHLHAHRSMEARDGKFVMAKKPTPPAPPPPPPPPPPASKPATPPPAKTPAAPVAAAAAAVGNVVNDVLSFGQGVASFTPFCSLPPTHKIKRATAAQIASKGNTGTANNYGCNMMLVKSSAAPQYKYTAEFINDGPPSTCGCFNKIGPNGLIDGFFEQNVPLRWKMASGAKQFVAFDSNSQGGCVCTPGEKLAVTSFGQVASTWLETDFDSSDNGHWSGFDASCLVPAKYGLDIIGMKVCGDGTCSTIFPGGKGINAYLAGMEDFDGVGGNKQASELRLQVNINYTG